MTSKCEPLMPVRQIIQASLIKLYQSIGGINSNFFIVIVSVLLIIHDHIYSLEPGTPS